MYSSFSEARGIRRQIMAENSLDDESELEYEGQDAPGWMLEWIAEWSNEIGESKTESLRSDVELEWNPDSKPNEHHSRNDPSLFRSSKLVSASTSVFEMQQKVALKTSLKFQ